MKLGQMKNIKDFKNRYDTMSPSCICSSQRSLHEIEFKSFLRSYVYFLNEYQHSEREFKKFMRSQENLPRFLKDVLVVDDPGLVLKLFHSFLRSHICYNGNCAKRTHKKCSACRSVSYCSTNCHTQRWSKHEESCKAEVNGKKMYETSRQTIMDQLMKHFSDDKILVSMEVFQQELLTAFFVALSPVVEETTKLDALTELLFLQKDIPKSSWLEEIKSLKKEQYAKMRKMLSAEKIISQWSAAWETHFDDFLDVWYNSEDFMVILSQYKRHNPCQIS